ncbi:centromere protein F [Indicator indicator]|uniref:centromere protein F n=1 Tax=Indicator indicator TaxID=1002788 RepID=UPI0023DFC3E5|nr:centromere protein F [Indicator indicator]
MSWAVEEWKEGLSPRVLQKIHELESQVDKLKKECQQRQFQLESLEAALQKQKQKVENEKNEAATLKRENQSLMELCDSLEKAKQKVSHDLHVKESQVSIQAGQLNSSKKNIERLEQELKRYKCELERSQQTSIADLSFSGSPQKSFIAPLTPVQSHNDTKFEELEEKYKKKVQGKKTLEMELRARQVKKISQPHPQRSLSHREIARHQASSSVFSWQQEETPSRKHETPARGSSTTSFFPWEKETNSSILSEKNGFDNSFTENCNSSFIIQLKAQNQELNSTVRDLEQQLQAQEKVKKSHMIKQQETELQLNRMKLELTEKDKVLNQTRDKLTQMRTQLDQATTQVQMMEQKVKRLSEELNCQRQNAESARQSLEQKIKAKEKEYQQELSCHQRALQTLDQQWNQIRNNLSQELQQAKNDFNALQAEFDKVKAVKQCLEHSTSDLTQKLCRAEQALLAAQAKEMDLTRSFEEVKQEKNLINCQLEKKLQQIHQLEEELSMVKQSLKQSQNFAEELKNKNTSQETELKLLEEKFKKQESSLLLEKLKTALADMEKQQDSTQILLKEKDNYIKEQNCKISKMEGESEALQKLLGFKQRECEDLQKEATAFSQWKNENDHLINKLKSEKEGMLAHINELESSLQSQQIKNCEHSEKLRMLETECDRKNTEIRELKDVLECKSAELEEQKKAFDELLQKAECSDKKYCKEIENMSCKIFQFTNQISELEEKLQLAATEGLQKEQRYHDLLAEYEKICCLVKEKDTSGMTNNGEVNLPSGQDKTVLGSMQLAANNCIAEDPRCAKPYLEVGKTKDLAILQDQISSLEISLLAQKQLNSNQQQQYEDLLQIKGEAEEKLLSVEQMHESFVTETKQHISNLQDDISTRQKLVEESLAILEEKDMQLQTLNERLETQQGELQDLKINNKLLEDSVRQLKHMSETWDSEKKVMSSTICSYSKEVEELTEENAILKNLSRALEKEQITLLETNKSISDGLKEKEEIISEMSEKHREEQQRSESRTEEIKTELKVLQANYKSVEEENVKMVSILREQTVEFEEKKAKLEQEQQFFCENKDILHKLKASEQMKKDLIQEFKQLHSEFSSIQQVPSTELDCLTQEALNVRATQNTMQEKCALVFQDKGQSRKELETKSESLMCGLSCEQKLHSEQFRKSMEEKDAELNKYQVKLELLQMDFEDRELCLENYKLKVIQLETELKGTEAELEKNVREKERLQQELLSVKELKTLDSAHTVLDEDGYSLEYDYDSVSQNCGQKGMDESCSSFLLASSLQAAMNNLSEPEKICERLQSENVVSASGFKVSKPNDITGINMEEEKENIMNADKNSEKAIFPEELMDQSDNCNLSMHFDNKEMSFRLRECCTGPCSDHKDLKLSSEEVKIHFAEGREKFLSFQDEHTESYRQHCSMCFRIPQLQSCTETLKAENSALSKSLSSAYKDSVSVLLSSSQTDTLSKLDETKSMVSFSNLFDLSSSFTEASEVADSSNSGMCNWIEEMNQPDSSPEGATYILVKNSHNAHRSDSVGECSSITPKKSNLEGRIEELQMLCQTYKKAIKVLQDQFHIQENMKNEEIQELRKVILSERTEIDQLKQQNLSDEKEWQQKLKNVTMEMEYKLAAERKQTEILSLELEAARFQLQVLDLSSHSLLCTDTENNTEEDNSPCQLGVPIQNSVVKSYKPKSIPTEKMTVGGTSVRENVTETTEARSMEDYTEKISGEHKCRNMSGKLTSLSDHANSSMFLGAGDFCGNQITTQVLQEEAKQQTAENLKLMYETEESYKHVDLLMKVEQLNSELNFQNVRLTPKSSAFAELKKASVGEEENCDIQENLESVSENKQLYLTVVSLDKEPENVKSELKVHKVRLSNAADALDDVEMNKRDCHEPFLADENELRTPKFEQVSTENHEHDIEMLQAKCQQLQGERDINMKTLSSFQEHLASVTAERNGIGQELTILFENKEQLDKKYQKLQEKLKELESTKTDSAEIIRRLEDELRTQTNLLETAKSDLNQLSNEKDHLLQKLQSFENDAMSLASEKEKLQNEAADWKKEKELIVRKLEKLQSQLSSSETENSKLYRSLEVLLMEKSELAARLSSAQKEVDQMRCGIEKLKVKIESDEKKKHHMAEKLKESERKADSLLDKIERLERELEMSEKNLEDTVIQSEVAKAEAETLTMEMEEMTEKLKLQIDALTSQKDCLAKDLKEKQERILELESSNLTIAKLLEEKEEDYMQIRDGFENTVVLLQSELKDISEKLELSCREEADARAKEQILINELARLEQDKTILLRECQEIKKENTKLDQTREVLVQELMDCKQSLYEKVQENDSLQRQVKETEELSLELAHMQQEHECWYQEKKRLQNLIAELKLKEQHLSDNESFPDILNVLKVSYKDLEKELESTVCEKSTLYEKVNELTESHAELQVKLRDTEGKIAKLQEEFATERNKFAEEMQFMQEHLEKNKAQLHLAMSEKNELTKSLEMVQKELQEKESEMKREISEYKDRLLQAEKEHQDALTEANRKNEVEIEACQEKVNSLQHFISSQKLEIECLKSNKEELNNSLKEANQTLGELLKMKADNSNLIVQLKKENEFAHNEVQLWMQSCKQMEQEKEMLQKQLAECDELSTSKKEGAEENAVVEEINRKLEELQESTEVKIREANENLEKYSSLIVKYYKLEEENDMLKTQVILLSGQLKQPASDVVSTPLLSSDNSLTVSNQSIKEMRSGEDTTKLSSKRQRYEDNGKDNEEPRCPMPETSSKKKRKGDIFQKLLDQENTDDEPDGLPEVVEKGFADIPTGKTSPYILRRTTANLSGSHCLASPGGRLPLLTQEIQKCRPDKLGERSCSTPGGSKPQKVTVGPQPQAVTTFLSVKSMLRSPLCQYMLPRKTASDNTRENHMVDKDKNSLNEQGLPEQDEQKENCKVQ